MAGLYTVALLIGCVVAFLCGSIPFAILIGKRFYGVDVRDYGSGNTGSTNVARVLGLKPGLVVFACDVGKGVVGVLIAIGIAHLFEALFVDPVFAGATILSCGSPYDALRVAAALSAMLGHDFSPFLSFHGGKGVATALGGLLVICPWGGLSALAVFIVVCLITRYISLGSLISSVSLPIFIHLFYPDSPVLLVLGLGIMVALWIAHRKNISRLIHHKEPKFTLGHAGRGATADDGKAGQPEGPDDKPVERVAPIDLSQSDQTDADAAGDVMDAVLGGDTTDEYHRRDGGDR